MKLLKYSGMFLRQESFIGGAAGISEIFLNRVDTLEETAPMAEAMEEYGITAINI